MAFSPLCGNYTTARLKFRVDQFLGSRSGGIRQGLNALNENTIVKVVLIGLEMKRNKRR